MDPRAVVAAWRGLIDQPAFAAAPTEFRVRALNLSAMDLVGISETTGSQSELEAAVDDLRLAAGYQLASRSANRRSTWARISGDISTTAG